MMMTGHEDVHIAPDLSKVGKATLSLVLSPGWGTEEHGTFRAACLSAKGVSHLLFAFRLRSKEGAQTFKEHRRAVWHLAERYIVVQNPCASLPANTDPRG